MEKKQIPVNGFEVRVKDKETELIYTDPSKKNKGFGIKKSRDGLNFSDAREHFKISSSLGKTEKPDGIIKLATSRLSDKNFFLTYGKKNGSGFFLYGAASTNGHSWKKTGRIKDITSFGMVVPEYSFEKQHILYFGDGSIKVAWSQNLDRWKIFDKAILKPRKNYFDHSSLQVARVLLADEGILLFYSAKNEQKRLCLGAALIDRNDPENILWRSEQPLWKQPEKRDFDKTQILGIIQTKEKFIAYFQSEGGNIFLETLRYAAQKTSQSLKKSDKKKDRKEEHPAFTRSHANPILKPRHENAWEATAAFNPAALRLEDKTHLIYRAVGTDGKSQFGYASSKDGLIFDERLPHPAYAERDPKAAPGQAKIYSPIIYPSGGSWGGYEDPRMVEIGGRVYVTFNMFENWILRVGFISISKKDFLAKRFHKWDGPHVLSHSNRDKNWVLFPEKINGKFAVLHSIIGDSDDRVRIEYIGDLKKLSKKTFESPDPQRVRDRLVAWHTHVRSAGPPPIKTDRGWLVFYHANDLETYKYKVGVMLLDLKDPTKIIVRAKVPVLAPDFHYENDGKPGIVYASGATIQDGKIHLYYGGADKVTCAATAPLDRFLTQLMSSGEITMAAIKLQ